MRAECIHACLLAVTAIGAPGAPYKTDGCSKEKTSRICILITGQIHALVASNHDSPIPPSTGSGSALGTSTVLPTPTSLATLSGDRQDLSVDLVPVHLHAAIENRDNKYFGNIADTNTLGNSTITDILKSEFGQVTPEYSMKWAATEAMQGVFALDNANVTARFTKNNDQILRCHTLIWHRDLPDWVYKISSPEVLTRVIEALTSLESLTPLPSRPTLDSAAMHGTS